MIRHLYTAKLKPGVRPEPIAAWREALLGLRIEGMQALLAGPDLELRAGNDSFAIVADFDDAEAWVRYDEDAEHNRIRPSGPVRASGGAAVGLDSQRHADRRQARGGTGVDRGAGRRAPRSNGRGDGLDRRRARPRAPRGQR